jgi:hypothetical protein
MLMEVVSAAKTAAGAQIILLQKLMEVDAGMLVVTTGRNVELPLQCTWRWSTLPV